MNKRRWKATWYEGGYPREYLFSAPDSRILARLDFQLLLVEQGQPIPRTFELEEGQFVTCVVFNADAGRQLS